MIETSNELVFARLQRLHARALRLVYGDGPQAQAKPGEAAAAEVEARLLAARVDLRLPHLAAACELDALAVDVLLCALMADTDPFARLLLRAVQREAGRPWLEVGTVAELLALPMTAMPALRRALAPDAPLRRFALVEQDDGGGALPLVTVRLRVATRVAQFLTGDDRLPEDTTLHRPQPPATRPAPLVDKVLARARRALAAGEPLVLEIVGRRHTGRHALARELADRLGLPLLSLDLGLGLGTGTGLGRASPAPLPFRLAEARREAHLHGALLCLRNWEAALPAAPGPGGPAGEGPAPAPPAALPDELARFFDTQAGIVILTAEEPQPLLGLHARAAAQVQVPFPSPSERGRLLGAALARRGLVPAPDVDLVSIARRFALDPRRIEVAARTAGELSADRAADLAAPVTVSHVELVEGCRRQVRHDLQSLATRVVNSHRWEDLVIPVEVYESLLEMIDYVRHAQKVYDQWGFGGRHSLSEGVSALFAGPPGTGKTMCASVVARELDMELFRVDLSRVVSKWIGETEKNLSKVFDEAQHSNAIILFDEADALFAKRTEVKSSVDRYANLEVNYLLQRMEAFGGVTILTTNFEDTIDTAFKRRLTFRMRFERPDAAARAALWGKVFPRACEMAPDFDPKALGELFDLSGGSIRNAAVRAAFFAAAAHKPVDQTMCMRAAERESREMGQLTRTPPPPRRPVTPEEPPPPSGPNAPPSLVPLGGGRRR